MKRAFKNVEELTAEHEFINYLLIELYQKYNIPFDKNNPNNTFKNLLIKILDKKDFEDYKNNDIFTQIKKEYDYIMNLFIEACRKYDIYYMENFLNDTIKNLLIKILIDGDKYHED